MRLTVAIAASVGLFAAATAYGQGPTREFDRFKDRTSYAVDIELSKLNDRTPSITLKLDASVLGDKPIGKTDKVTLTAMVTYDMSRTKRCAGAGVDGLIDGKPVALDKAMPPFFYGNHAITGTSKDFTYAQAQAFANAKTMEFRICGEAHTLSPEQIATFKDFWALAQQPAPKQP